jgi:hypothetical protein
MLTAALGWALAACHPTPEVREGDTAPPADTHDPCHDVEEICNDLDDNCNGVVDDGLRTGFYADEDGDGFGDEFFRIEACEAPDGYVRDATDCDDQDPSRYPGAVEFCDYKDNDCNRIVDDDVATTMYHDLDHDLFGNPLMPFEACSPLPGLAYDNTDCDDSREGVHPGADEYCDGLDNDCDGEVDEEPVDPVTLYLDEDRDGYGTLIVVGEGCEPPPGASFRHDDCEDDDAGVHPHAFDHCDGRDQDCDGEIDEDHRVDWMLIAEYNNILYEVDQATAALSVIGTLVYPLDLTSIDIRQDSDAWAFDTENQRLGHLDVCAATFSPVGDPGHGHTGGIVFRGTELYGIPAEWDDVVTYDLFNASPTVIGPLGLDLESSGVAYDCTTDTVYGVDSYGGTLFKIDPVSGTAYDLISLGITFEGNGLEFDSQTGTLLLSDLENLWRVDPATGSRTLIGSFPYWGFDNLALHPRCAP